MFFFTILRTGPLYRIVAYDAVCFNGTEGLYFVSITQFCIVAFAMIMVTLRFAFKPTVVDDETTEDQAQSATPANEGNNIKSDGSMMQEESQSAAPVDRDNDDKNMDPMIIEQVDLSPPMDVGNIQSKIHYQSMKAQTTTVVPPADGGEDIDAEIGA